MNNCETVKICVFSHVLTLKMLVSVRGWWLYHQVLQQCSCAHVYSSPCS